MHKESLIELQKIDCNCNDCKFMIRDVDRFNAVLEVERINQLNAFNSEKQKLVNRANYHRVVKGDLEKW